jgi:hypothetical protein
MVMCWPFGTSGRYVETGSSRVSLPSWTSWRMTVPVHVLVLLPIRTWSASVTGSAPPSARVPKVAVQSPSSGECTSTTAPGVSVSVKICCSLGLKAEA